MWAFLKNYCGLFLRIGIAKISATLLAVIFTPSILYALEKSQDIVVSYENVMRVFVGLMIFLWAMALIAWRGFPRTRWVVGGLVIFLLGTLSTYIFDGSHPLREEFSWIRYWTGGALIAAAITILAAALPKNRPVISRALWIILGILFLYGASDELFQIHELIGDAVESAWGLPHFFSDLITLGYAVLGLAVGAALWVSERKRNSEVTVIFRFYAIAALLFLVAMIFDTFDFALEDAIQAGFHALGSRSNTVFSDFWIVLYDPTELFNFLEETLEFSAAVVFFLGSGVGFWPEFFCDRNYRIDAPRHMIAAGLWVATVIAGVILIIAFPPTIGTPLQSSDWKADRILGPEDGTNHADDVKWNSAWGLVVGNESGPNVLRISPDGLFEKLRDPQNHLKDVDSIVLAPDVILASDSSMGRVNVYTRERGWREYLRSSQIPTPEALDISGSDLYVVDETISSVFRYDMTSGETTKIMSKDDGLEAPEGILVQKDGRILVTDDVSGKIWQVANGKISRWGLDSHQEPEALAQSSDGSVWVTDNRTRTVTHYTAEGTAFETIRFALNYEDLLGITVDDLGQLYVVTGDGYGSGASMPTVVWRLTRND